MTSDSVDFTVAHVGAEQLKRLLLSSLSTNSF
jgi:hypothetical protein